MTIDDVIQDMEDRGLHVTRRALTQWRSDGLLPEATRPAVAGKRGRSALVFPEGTADVVAWLARYRRYMRSAEAARFWLWMEGFPHASLDMARLGQKVQCVCTLWWQAMEQALPLNSDDDAVRDALDKLALQPLLEAGADDAELAAHSFLFQGIIGLADAEDVQENPARLGLERIAAEKRIPLDVLPADLRSTVLANLPQVLAVPRSITVQWEYLRVAWHDFVGRFERLEIHPQTSLLGISLGPMRERIYRSPYLLAIISLQSIVAASGGDTPPFGAPISGPESHGTA